MSQNIECDWADLVSQINNPYKGMKMPTVKRVIRKGDSNHKPTRTKKAPQPKISLPSKPNEVPTSLEEFIICIFGRKNIGKSSLAAQFPKSFTMMFERGRRNLPIYQVPGPDEEELDWARAKKYISAFLSSDQFQTIVIDTADRAYKCCFDYVCQKTYGVKNPDQYPASYEVWNAIRDEFDDVISEIRRTDGKSLIIVSHEKVKPLNTKAKGLIRFDDESVSNVALDRMEPSFTGQCFAVVQEIVDYVLYYGFRDGLRCITVRSPNDVVWTACGDSEGTFRQPDGEPVLTFPVGKSAAEAYETLQKAFRNEVWDVDYQPPRESRVRRKKKKKTVN